MYVAPKKYTERETQETICLAPSSLPEKPGAYISPNKRSKDSGKTFEQLFPELGPSTGSKMVSLKLSKQEPAVGAPKSFAARIQEKLDKEREAAAAAAAANQEDDDGLPQIFPKAGKYLLAVEATNLRKKKELEKRNNIFESSSEEEPEQEAEDEFDEFYDDEEDQHDDDQEYDNDLNP